MPWTTEDVDKHFKGLSKAQKERWVEVANDALSRCQEKGGTDCDASAIRQANAVVSRMTAQGFICYPVGDSDGFAAGEIAQVESRKGISAVMGDGEIVAFLFDKQQPHNWTMENIEGWLSKKVGSIRFTCAAPSTVSIPADDSEIPGSVRAAKERLIKSGADTDPMIVRVHQTTGRFEAAIGDKINLSERFLRAFGPSYVDHPAYEGHKGFGDTDARSRIGKILGFEERDGKFYFWLHVSAGRPDIRARIREDMALKKDGDETGGVQFSLEGYPTRVETDADGYHEPVEMHRQGKALALVEVAGATGTMIDRIAAKLAVQTILEETMTDKTNALLGAEDITKLEKFNEALALSLAAASDAPLDEKNPLTPIIDKYLTAKAPELSARAQGINADAVAALTPAEMRLQVISGVTKEEMPWLAAFSEAVKDLPADAIKAIPAFTDAVNSIDAEQIGKIPSVVTAMNAAKDFKTEAMTAGMEMALKVMGMGGMAAGASPIIGRATEDKQTGEEESKFMAIVAKAKEIGYTRLNQDEAEVIKPKLHYLVTNKLIKL